MYWPYVEINIRTSIEVEYRGQCASSSIENLSIEYGRLEIRYFPQRQSRALVSTQGVQQLAGAFGIFVPDGEVVSDYLAMGEALGRVRITHAQWKPIGQPQSRKNRVTIYSMPRTSRAPSNNS